MSSDSGSTIRLVGLFGPHAFYEDLVREIHRRFAFTRKRISIGSMSAGCGSNPRRD
jgi:hypothetical protein